MITKFMDEINKAYTEYYEYMNNFIRTTYNIIEQDKKEIHQLNKEKDDLNKEKDKMNEKIQELTKKNMLLLEKENESTNLILKLDKTIADLRNELRKAKNI
jgi:uncharacterized coiled-coil DUF342 family protein